MSMGVWPVRLNLSSFVSNLRSSIDRSIGVETAKGIEGGGAKSGINFTGILDVPVNLLLDLDIKTY